MRISTRLVTFKDFFYMTVEAIRRRFYYTGTCRSRTGEDKLVAVIKVGTVWATRGDRDA
jgi:hypothetical protein